MKQILYYSWNGKTRICAGAAAKLLHAGLTEIQERYPRKKGFFGFLRSGYEATKQKTAEIQMLPALTADTVVLAFPVWASKTPPAVNTALRTLDFNGRRVIAIITMGGAAKQIPCYDILTEQVQQRGGTVAAIIPVVTGGTSEEQWEATLKRELTRLGELESR